MVKQLILSAAIVCIAACASVAPKLAPETTPSVETAQQNYDARRAGAASPSTAYRAIDVTPTMKAGITASRSFELIYALEYATNHTDKAVPETFGGLSSMVFSRKVGASLQFEVITDQGYFGLLDVPDAMQSTRQLTGASKLALLPTRGPDGAALSGGNNIDSEGLARTPEGRLISLERNHRLLRVTDNAAFMGQASAAGPMLTGFDGLEPNGGMEALVALPDGRYLASAEYGRNDQGPEVARKPPYWIFSLDQTGPIAPAGNFINSGGFGVTEARVMDNDLWVLKREYDPRTQINKARLERCPLAGVLVGAPVCNLELALEPPFVMDNYEGLEIFKHPTTGDLYFYIMSDDNFSPSQRTIMLAFKVPG